MIIKSSFDFSSITTAEYKHKQLSRQFLLTAIARQV
jgi:hypothetical protein